MQSAAAPANIEAIRATFTNLVMARGLRDPRQMVRAESALFDACLDGGMGHDEPNHIQWAGGVLTKWWAA